VFGSAQGTKRRYYELVVIIERSITGAADPTGESSADNRQVRVEEKRKSGKLDKDIAANSLKQSLCKGKGR